jgi:plasmid stability protein
MPAGFGDYHTLCHTQLCGTLKSVNRNVTFSLPEDLLRDAKIAAASRDLSLNALVRQVLEAAVPSRDSYREAGERLLRWAEKGLYEMEPGSWNRDEIHER